LRPRFIYRSLRHLSSRTDGSEREEFDGSEREEFDDTKDWFVPPIVITSALVVALVIYAMFRVFS